jgi:hypothetical protein
MPYEAEISRANPTCFLFLVDHSTSMVDPIMGVPGNPRKAQFVADALNKVIQSLVVSASKDLDVRRYYKIGVLGYGYEVTPLLGGDLQSQELAWIDQIYASPLRVEERMKKEPDGVGGVIEIIQRFPIWVDPMARGQTPMCAVLERAAAILRPWVEENPFSYPPTVINLTDGEANDGDPRKAAQALTSLATQDGNVLLLTVHASSNQFSQQVFFPSSPEVLPDHASQVMYELSSPLPEHMRRTAQDMLGVEMRDGVRGIVYNADIAGIVQALEIGTRPANLR